MGQYFIYDETTPSQKKEIIYYFKQEKFEFITDNGIFSKDHVDPATDILLDTIPPLKGSLLDLGCGYGCIGIVLAKSYNLALTQVDVNKKAVELTSENCTKNVVSSAVILSNGFDNITGRFDTITLNPPIHAGKNVTYKMYEEAIHHLNINGSFYIVTFKKHGAESTREKIIEVFGNCETLYKKKGIYVFVAKKVI